MNAMQTATMLNIDNNTIKLQHPSAQTPSTNAILQTTTIEKKRTIKINSTQQT